MSNPEVDATISNATQLLENKNQLFQTVDQQLSQDFSGMDNEQLRQLKNNMDNSEKQLMDLSDQIRDLRNKINGYTNQDSKSRISSGSSIFERVSRSQSYKDKQNQKSSMIDKLMSLSNELKSADQDIDTKKQEVNRKSSKLFVMLNPNFLSSSSSISSPSPSTSSSSNTPKTYGYTTQQRRMGGRHKKSKKTNKKSNKKSNKKRRTHRRK